MKKSAMKVRGDRWCSVEIRLEDGELSISGCEGPVLSTEEAEKQAKEYWVHFFEENLGELILMNRRLGCRFVLAEDAAAFVLRTDGKFHGLDVHKAEGDRVFLVESCGQIRDTISDFFPQVKPLLPWHLNHLSPGCEHQDALNWGRGKTVAVTNDSWTEAQRTVIEHDIAAKHKDKLEKELLRRWADLCANKNAAIAWIKKHNGGHCGADDLSMLMGAEKLRNSISSIRLRAFERWLREEVDRDNPSPKFEGELYKDCLGAPCPTCGYKYGTQWLKRELPPEIIELAEHCLDDESAA